VKDRAATNEALFPQGTTPQNRIEIKDADVEPGLRVELEQADICASIKPVYWVISDCEKDV